MAATATPDTGHGATITFTTTGGTWKCRTISGLEVTLPDVNISHLTTSGDTEYMPGDLRDNNPVTLQVLFQGTQGLPALGTEETTTITFPIPGGGATTAPNIAGTAYINRIKYPNFATNELQIAEITFRFNGLTGPTYTAAS